MTEWLTIMLYDLTCFIKKIVCESFADHAYCKIKSHLILLHFSQGIQELSLCHIKKFIVGNIKKLLFEDLHKKMCLAAL